MTWIISSEIFSNNRQINDTFPTGMLLNAAVAVKQKQDKPSAKRAAPNPEKPESWTTLIGLAWAGGANEAARPPSRSNMRRVQTKAAPAMSLPAGKP
ncbi:hypothetical protein D3C80_1738660 [compost metagenome]